MTTPAPSPAQARKAALLLHTLPRGDRDWMLARLTPPERSTLAPLLSELETLGFPADRALLEDVLESEASGPVPLESADPGELAAILRDEPAGVVARLLALAEWPWREAVLEALGSAKRREIEGLLARARASGFDASTVAPAASLLREQLVAVVSARLYQAPAHVRSAHARRFRWFRVAAGRPAATTRMSRFLTRRAR